jgi:dienelactone hydrolase
LIIARQPLGNLFNMGHQFDPRGWIHWPDSEELSVEFMRLLGAAQEGGSTISECFLAASQIDSKDEDSWYREWKKLADASSVRGSIAAKRGYTLSAQSNWLRAINYYQAAAFHFGSTDKKQQDVFARMQTCARHYIEHLTPAGEVVEIPWLDGYALEGYFLSAPGASDRTPVLICMGEPGHRKEEYLYKTARYARDRGMSLLAVDLMGSGANVQFEEIVGRPDLEMAVGYVMDYLTTRSDVDEGRIAILGDGAASSFVARGVALDQRFAAAVCDGGIWDLHERAFLMNRISWCDAGMPARNGFSSFAQDLGCPVLITMGEHGWLEADHVTNLFHQLKGDCRDVSLKIFRGSETAASQGHSDNPTLANEFIFDWLADRLEMGTCQALHRRPGVSPNFRYPSQPSGRPSRDDS